MCIALYVCVCTYVHVYVCMYVRMRVCRALCYCQKLYLDIFLKQSLSVLIPYYLGGIPKSLNSKISTTANTTVMHWKHLNIHKYTINIKYL